MPDPSRYEQVVATNGQPTELFNEEGALALRWPASADGQQPPVKLCLGNDTGFPKSSQPQLLRFGDKVFVEPSAEDRRDEWSAWPKDGIVIPADVVLGGSVLYPLVGHTLAEVMQEGEIYGPDFLQPVDYVLIKHAQTEHAPEALQADLSLILAWLQ